MPYNYQGKDQEYYQHEMPNGWALRGYIDVRRIRTSLPIVVYIVKYRLITHRHIEWAEVRNLRAVASHLDQRKVTSYTIFKKKK